MNESPNYYAVIPAIVRYCKELKPNEKLLYGEITALAQSSGKCFASNSYFAELYETSKETVSRWVSNLARLGFVTVEIEYKHGTREILKRYISINTYCQNNHDPIDEKVNTPIDKKVKDNNTSTNNTSINNRATKNLKRTIDELSADEKEKLRSDIEHYIAELEKKAFAHNVPMPKCTMDYDDFVLKCQSNGYKYANFFATYQTWHRNNVAKEAEVRSA